MLVSVGIYILALYATLTGNLLLVSSILFLSFILLLIKNLFPIKYILVWMFLFYFGAINTLYRLKDVDYLLSIAPLNCKIEGSIVSIPQGVTEGRPKFFFKVKSINYESVQKDLNDEKILVTMNSSQNLDGLKIYNSGVLEGRLSTPFKAGNPSQFDYGEYLRNHSAYAVFYANKFDLTENELSFKAKVLQKINDYREYVIEIHSRYLKSPNLEILGGIVFGDDAVSPPKTIKASFANSGLLHILAASGMNVAFIYGFFFWFFSLLKLKFRPKVILGMIMVCIYSLMTGLGASIIRATGMLLFVLVGKLIDRDAHSISLLSFVALLMLLYNPLFINDVGFQLSFIVTFGILIMAPLVMRFNNKLLDYIVGTITIPIIAQAWVIPIQIFYFGSISLYSVFANIMSVPLLAIISFGGFVSALLASIRPVADFVCKLFDLVLNPIISILVNISDFWGHFSNSVIQMKHPTIFQIAIYYILLICITAFLHKTIREKFWKKLLFVFLSLLLICLATIIPVRNNNLEIITFDVGNADCFLLKTPNNEYIMIDAGRNGYKGGKSQAEIIVLKYLKDRGIKNIHSLIVTHFDNDHCGGVVDILNNINVDYLYINDLEHKSNSAKLIYSAAKSNSTKLILATNQQEVYTNNQLVITNFLGPSCDSDNENSIVSLIEYNNFSMLFTGDIGINGLNNIIKDLPHNITVLKVPHHGALGSLDKNLVNYLNPKVSIISVGENKFGHPALYTLKMLENTQIFRTDIDNSILIKVNKKDMKILTYDINKRKYRQK